LVGVAKETYGRIDGLVNNAAWIVRSNLETTDAQLFDRVCAVNLRAPLLLIRAAIESLKQTQGCVINIGSVNGYAGEEKQLAYSVSKGGLETMTKNLADAYGPERVRFFHFVVGWVLTPNEYELKIAEGRPKNWPEEAPPEMVPSGTMTQPDDVARAAVFWLSDQSRPFSGGVFELEQYPWLGRHPKMVGESMTTNPPQKDQSQ
jgi:NAD(P)-dependent dehydrogenase (short-subunit alcohol dehydrogenase family)